MNTRKRRSLDYKSTGTGEVIRVPTQEHSDAADSVLQLFALLAYPHISEQAARDKIAEVLHAALYKARIWDRHNDRSVRMRVPLAVRKMKIRKIQQQLNKWIKRINRRLPTWLRAFTTKTCASRTPRRNHREIQRSVHYRSQLH